ncbi:MAG: AsmA family protein, partial [Terriglobia bacterium]
MSRAARIGIIIAVVVAAFLIATLIIAPRLFEIDTYRPEVISLLEEKTGREVEIGHLSLVLFPTATIRADNVAIANPAGFPSGNMLTVKRISARLDLGALLHRQIVIRTLKLDQLALNLTSNGKGNWNSQMSDPPAPHVARASGPPTFALGEISKIELSDGTLSVKSLAAGRSATPTICKGVSGELDNVSLAMLGRAGSSSSLPSRDLTRGVPKIPNATGSLSVVKLNVGALQATRITSKIKTSSAEIQLNDLRFDFYQGKGTGNVRLEVAGADPQFQSEAHLS